MPNHHTYTHALVRPPSASMIDGRTTQDLGVPVLETAMIQHAAYCKALRACGLRVHTLPSDDRFPDGCFVEDTAVIYRNLVVITQPGAPSRRDEPEAIDDWFSETNPDFTYVDMSGDQYLDGGDVLMCAGSNGEVHVLIGLSLRTNRAGAECLRDALCDYDASLHVDFVEFSGPLHLKSGLSEIRPGVLLLSDELHTNFPLDFAQVHRVPAAEGYAVNLLPVNDSLLIPAGYPTVSSLAGRYYADIHELDMSEFARIDGGLTCLSLRY